MASTTPMVCGVEALGREPHRQERQVHAQRDEGAGVEQRHPPCEMPACEFLGITRHRVDCASAAIEVMPSCVMP